MLCNKVSKILEGRDNHTYLISLRQNSGKKKEKEKKAFTKFWRLN